MAHVWVKFDNLIIHLTSKMTLIIYEINYLQSMRLDSNFDALLVPGGGGGTSI